MSIYSLLADGVVAVHITYVSVVIFGLLLILLGGVLKWRWVRNFRFRILHLTLIAIVVFEALMGITCPLTDWEYALRQKAGKGAEGGSFVGRFLHDMMFVDATPRLLTVCYCLFGLLVLVTLWLIPPNWPKKVSSSKLDR